MKLRMFLISLALLLSSQLFAQTFSFAREKKVSTSIGIVAGGNLSSVITSAPMEAQFGFRPGFNAGIAANFRFLKRNSRSTAKTGVLAVQPEVRYTTMGGNSEESNLSLGYVMVPVMLQVYPTKSFYIEVGPEFAMNLSHSPNNIAISSSQLNLKNFKPNDIMLGAGLGFMFGGFNIGARYSYGFSDMASNLPWRNSLIQLNLGYLFQIKKKAIKVF